MNLDAVERIVQAVLYEGYMLYPYRPSSLKNRQRWTFGGVYPRDYSEARDGAEPCTMRIECLVRGGPRSRVRVRAGFLQLVERQPAELLHDGHDGSADAGPACRPVPALAVGGRSWAAWQEAIERQVDADARELQSLCAAPHATRFDFAAARELETLRDAAGGIGGLLVRTRQALCGMVEVGAEPVDGATWRVGVTIANTTPLDAAALREGRDAAALHALASCHAVLQVEDGEFVSLTDPPGELRSAAAACRNAGAWPVLAGVEPDRHLMLGSPIILYDYPQVAPESPIDFYDATEIDEMLALRILTMTEAEKREMAAADPRSRALLERVEALAPSELQQLHGAVRALRPVGAPPTAGPAAQGRVEPDAPPPARGFDALPRLVCLKVGGVELNVGDRVRLRPRGRADIFDLALAGRLATIESIERDFEDRVHVAVTVLDDPGRDFGIDRMPGHRFFYAADELEPAPPEEARR